MSNFRQRLVMAKIGSGTYPADDTPDGTNAVLTRNLAVQVFQGNTETLDYDKPTLGGGKEIYTGPHAAVSFDVDLSGSGTAGDAPAYGSLLQMCGLSETVNAGVDVTYALVSSGFSWGSLYVNLAGELHKLTGARGNVTFNLRREASPSMSFRFLGLWDQTPTAVSAPTPSGWSDYVDPIPFNKANTPTFDVDGYAAKAEELSIDLGMDVQYRNVVNDEQVFIVDRAVTGRMAIEKPALADKDFYALVRAHTIIDSSVVHGTTAGNIATLNLKHQLKFTEDQDSQGISVMPFDLRGVPTETGDDEFSLVLT